jgi:hypothetical protein
MCDEDLRQAPGQSGCKVYRRVIDEPRKGIKPPIRHKWASRLTVGSGSGKPTGEIQRDFWGASARSFALRLPEYAGDGVVSRVSTRPRCDDGTLSLPPSGAFSKRSEDAVGQARESVAAQAGLAEDVCGRDRCGQEAEDCHSAKPSRGPPSPCGSSLNARRKRSIRSSRSNSVRFSAARLESPVEVCGSRSSRASNSC